ncbi:uncharacterized protein LOC143829876 isoform X2 [Paroedura picta]|uniref:uncharacterized protein LOC143829876 isoform X2 n=1 Tax=Paroedura picta TaxID=143630 RepID=UPI004056BC61
MLAADASPRRRTASQLASRRSRPSTPRKLRLHWSGRERGKTEVAGGDRHLTAGVLPPGDWGQTPKLDWAELQHHQLRFPTHTAKQQLEGGGAGTLRRVKLSSRTLGARVRQKRNARPETRRPKNRYLTLSRCASTPLPTSLAAWNQRSATRTRQLPVSAAHTRIAKVSPNAGFLSQLRRRTSWSVLLRVFGEDDRKERKGHAISRPGTTWSSLEWRTRSSRSVRPGLKGASEGAARPPLFCVIGAPEAEGAWRWQSVERQPRLSNPEG